MNTKLHISKLSLIAICILSASFARAEQEGKFTYSSAVTLTKYTGAGGSVTIPEKIAGVSVKVIDWEAFSKCIGLTEITIPSSVQEVGTRAFYTCTGLTKVSFLPGVKYIGDYAFQACTKLTEVSFPSSIISFGNMAFSECKNLVSVTFEGNAPELSNDNAFYGAAPGFTIRYFKGASGFTTPEWKGYKTVEVAKIPKSK